MIKKQTEKLLKELVAAARDKDFAGIADLVCELPQDAIDLNDERLKEAFVWSGASNDLNLVKSFLALGIPINTEFKQNSILGFAARIPFPDFLRALLDLGANPDHLDAMNTSPLIHVAKMSSMLDGRDHFLQNLSLLSERSKCVNTADYNQRTPLDYCCKGDWFEGVVVLLDKGACLEACDNNGWWALNGAVMSMDVRILTLLLQQDGALEIAGKRSGGAPSTIEFAAKHGRLRHVEALIAAGVSDQLPDGSSAKTVVNGAVKGREALDATLAKLGIKRNSS